MQSTALQNKPAASLSLDLDNKWAYLKTQGCGCWSTFPSYLSTVTPRILEQLRMLGRQRMTFFVVGKDAADAQNHDALSAIAQDGHELANHSFMHEPWLHLYSESELRNEFDKTEAAIEAICGTRPVGFRGPGFSTSAAVRQQLMKRGYLYDASVFPTIMGPFLRTYFMMRSSLSEEEKKKRSGLYGGFSNAFSTLNPYEIEPGLMELPVTTMPLLRVPIHMSYLMFLAKYSPALARLYWRTALTFCRVRGVEMSMLLHPTDFLDVQDVPEMSFFPGMSVPAEQKIALIQMVVGDMQKHFNLLPMGDHARLAASRIPSPAPIFQTQINTTR